MTVRRVLPDDVARADLRALVRDGLASAGLPLVVDERKLWETCRRLAAEHYAEVVEVNGEIVAYLGAQFHEHPWLNRCQLNVVGWYSKRPGAGVRLARRIISYARENPNVTTIQWWVNQQQATRACLLLRLLTGQDPQRCAGLVITV